MHCHLVCIRYSNINEPFTSQGEESVPEVVGIGKGGGIIITLNTEQDWFYNCLPKKTKMRELKFIKAQSLMEKKQPARWEKCITEQNVQK